MEEVKKKRKRIKGVKIGSSGPVKPYPIVEEILTAPQDDSDGVIYQIVDK